MTYWLMLDNTRRLDSKRNWPQAKPTNPGRPVKRSRCPQVTYQRTPEPFYQRVMLHRN